MQIREIDEQTAREFFATLDETALDGLLRDCPEIDSEIRDDWVKLGCYLKLRTEGVAHTWASLSACRHAAQMKNSDRTFNEKARHRMSGMGMLDTVVKRANRAGIQTQGKFYCGGLADRRGPADPRAWVSTNSDVLEVARDRNLTVRGAVNHQGHSVPPPVSKGLAPDIVQEFVGKALQQDPKLQEKVRKDPKQIREIQEKVIAKHGKRKA